ncbi:cytochrome b/b6 domain-containing protein [Arenibacterium sp. CAU 1754]
MSLTNTATRYGTVTKTFHWLIALGIFTVIPLGLIANDMAHTLNNPAADFSESFVQRTVFLFSLHKTIGVLIFLTALARILWAISQPRPGLLNADNRVEATLAHAVHWLLYGSLVLAPLTGWVHHAATSGFAPIWGPFAQSLPLVPKDPGVAALFSGLHEVFVKVLAVALALHIVGALKHHVIDRDATLRRMLPGSSNAPTPPEQTHSLMPAFVALGVWGIALGIGGALGLYAKQGHTTASTAQSAPLEQVQSDWQVRDGTLAIVVTQLGNPVEGQFNDWTAVIQFNERATPGPAGHVSVTIAIGSLTLGSVTDQSMGPDFFDTETFPTATFTGQIERTESGYVATGPLAIRDQSMTVALPFDLSIENDVATMSGKLTLNRLDYGVGASMPDESSLGFDVVVTVSLTAERSPGS